MTETKTKKNRKIFGMSQDVFMKKYGIAIILLAMIVFMCIASPTFRTSGNVISILQQISVNGVLALGMVFVRQGAVLDRSTFFWPGLGLEEADELILSFLSQFYGPHSAVPPRVVIPWIPGEKRAEDAERGTAESRGLEPGKTLPGEGGPEEPNAEGEDGAEEKGILETLSLALSDLRGGPVYIAAPRNADENRLVDMAKSNAREAARSKADVPLSERLALVLRSPRPVSRIECVDVSHTGGRATKVGMVVYEDGKPRKDEYRVWNIEGAGGDDYAALAMWAERRLEEKGIDADGVPRAPTTEK